MLLTVTTLAACGEDEPKQSSPQPSTSAQTYFTLDNNGEKIRWRGQKLLPGTRIDNLSNGEPGLVGRDFVVTSSALPYEQLTPEYRVTHIAGDNYRLSATVTLDMAAELTRLKTMPELTLVELQIDYSPLTELPQY
ncbi:MULTISPECIES: hypothetical protein [unclassified Pseudoalteromonas]|uniref:hypothetical protein n=1 Tax=unclassified Pseudoalteromonas TaxID=194690 RepID=UPI000CF6A20D|nr:MULTISPECIES: hypothetical protein [unclassified Pseudoalteromonas]